MMATKQGDAQGKRYSPWTWSPAPIRGEEWGTRAKAVCLGAPGLQMPSKGRATEGAEGRAAPGALQPRSQTDHQASQGHSHLLSNPHPGASIPRTQKKCHSPALQTQSSSKTNTSH